MATAKAMPALILGAILLSTPAGAGPLDSLSSGAGARAIAMGGAHAAAAADSSAAYWNPAALAFLACPDISLLQRGRAREGSNESGGQYLFLSAGGAVPKAGSWGVAAMRAGQDGIVRVTGLDSAGIPIEAGSFDVQDTAVMASWAFRPARRLSLGLTAKHEAGGTIGVSPGPGAPKGDASYGYQGLDLGALLRVGSLSLGLNIQDLVGTGVKWSNTETNPVDRVASNAKAGAAWSRALGPSFSMALAADLDSVGPVIHLGAEIGYRKVLALRVGTRAFAGGKQAPEPSIGAGFAVGSLSVDYAFISHQLTPMHYLGVTFRP